MNAVQFATRIILEPNMQITFDPNDPIEVSAVQQILADMSPEAVAQAVAQPMPPVQVSVDAVGNPVPIVPQMPPTSIVPQIPPVPPTAPPIADDPLPSVNRRTPSEVAPTDGLLTEESFRARLFAVGQRISMEKVQAFVVAQGYSKLSEVPATAYPQIITGLEAL